jgi:DNA-binding transcriptional MerR regulator
LTVPVEKEESIRTFTISELAAAFGVTTRTIRYYEECGLLASNRKTPTSHRSYNESDRARLKLILRGKRFGYSLSELGEIIKLYEVDPTQQKQIVYTLTHGFTHIQEIDERIEELRELREEMLEFARSFVDILEANEGKDQGEIKEFISGAKEIMERLDKL